MTSYKFTKHARGPLSACWGRFLKGWRHFLAVARHRIGAYQRRAGDLHHTLVRCNRHLRYLLCFGLSVSSVFALTLEQAIQRAEAGNFGLDALHQQRVGARERIAGAAALPDPKIQYTYFGESVETRTGPQEAIYSMSQTIPWLKKLETRKALATSNADTWSFLHQQGVLALRRDVTSVYSEVVYQDQAVQSTEANLQLIDDMRAIVEERVRGGGSLNALLRLEVELERTRDQLDRYKQARYVKRTELAALLSIEESALGALTAESPASRALPSLRSMLATLEMQNPELLALKQRTGSASQRADLSQLDQYPDFTFGVNYIQVGDNGPASDAGTDPWSVSMAVSLPIWGSKNSAAIQAANADKRSAEQLYRDRVLQLKAELSATLAAHADGSQRVQRYAERLIPLAEQALENSRSAYESDQLSVLELIDSERALLEINLNYARAVANVTQADAALNALTGAIH
ncbi:MAG: cobalt-zinc-cadmium efflux system outer membrane protein [Lentimonas sp.]|jgi:cobalt-zinc-cadmium efflux system outer membrane protein